MLTRPAWHEAKAEAEARCHKAEDEPKATYYRLMRIAEAK